jgi:tellurite resistance protein TerC
MPVFRVVLLFVAVLLPLKTVESVTNEAGDVKILQAAHAPLVTSINALGEARDVDAQGLARTTPVQGSRDLIRKHVFGNVGAARGSANAKTLDADGGHADDNRGRAPAALRDEKIFGDTAWKGLGSWFKDIEDVFKTPEEKAFFASTKNPAEWGIMFAALAAAFMVDTCFLSRLTSVRGHLAAVGFWLLVSAAYGIHVFFSLSSDRGEQYVLGYILEVILSIDNVFVFHMLFESFRPPVRSQHKAMFLGVLGAVFFRLVLFWFLNKIITAVHWIRAIFGVLLIFSGIKAASDNDEDGPIEDGVIVRCLRACLGSRLMADWDDSGNILAYDASGRICFTLLLPLVVCVEITDIVFATDSLTAKVAQIPNQHACFSSSAFAICALRALFFLLRDMVDYFQHLKYGLCIILVFIGIELLLADYVSLPASALIIVISVIFAVTLLSSVRAKHAQDLEQERLAAKGALDSECTASDLDDAAKEGGCIATK